MCAAAILTAVRTAESISRGGVSSNGDSAYAPADFACR